MKLNISNLFTVSLFKIVPAVFLLIAAYSCNEPLDRMLQEEYGESGTAYETGKVLFIIVDGASGKAVQEAVNSKKAPNIKSLTENAMYTYEGLAESKNDLADFSSERGWANLLTGVTTHKIGNDIEDIDTPSVLNLLKKSNPNLKTSLYASSLPFYNTFASDADNSQAGSDATVKDAVVTELSNEAGSISDFIIAEFNGIETVGKNDGFYDSNGDPTQEVISAINMVDGYIGQMMETLKKRPNFKKENWMVVVTSNYGGSITSGGASYYDYQNRNTFSLINNTRITSKLLQRPSDSELAYSYFSPYYSGSGATDRAVVRDPSLFDMESRATDKNSYTIQFMVYDNYREIVGSNPSGTQCVLSKRSTFSTSTSSSAPAGWNIYFVSSGGNSLLRFNSGQATGNVSTAYGVVRKDAPWSVFTYVFEEKGDAQYSDTLKLYINGELDQKVRINWNGKLSNDAPLTIGKISGSNTGAATRFFVTNVQFYNIALPPEFIKSNFGKTRIDEIENFEYWDNLLGYWPNDREEDYGGNVLKDYSKYGSVYGGINSGRSDMDIVGNLFWASGNSIEENIHPAPGDSYYKSVFNTVDLPYQVFMWLGEDIDSSWKLEGIGRSLNYTSVQQ